ncbi:putative glutamate carboxypeptidase LAMP1 [Cocos nucifera]|uniref:Putative glutamate carboxypeptidase LAMP1 n=1 Tax=Cocos nucifera TaxID=13894 RepID=A0A8K0N312_COCNU|nr:putative glutamate carboxypeptidase LAMP1 [Cocos nucifera]
MARPKDTLLLASTTTSTAARVLVNACSLVLLLHFTTSSLSKPVHLSLFVSFSDNATIARQLLGLTRHHYIAETPANFDTAAYVLSVFSTSSSFAVHSFFYDLSYPVRRSLTLSSNPPLSSSPTIAFDLVQEIYPAIPTSITASRKISPS